MVDGRFDVFRILGPVVALGGRADREALGPGQIDKPTDVGRMGVESLGEVWGRDGSIQYEQRYEYSYYGDAPYTAADGTKFDYTDKGYGFYYAGEPAQGYHRDPR